MQWSWCSCHLLRAIWRSDCRMLTRPRPGRALMRCKSTLRVPAFDGGGGPVKLSWYHILWKPAGFTAGVCLVSFGASFIYYHTTRKWARKCSDPWHWKREGKGLFGEMSRQWNMLTDSAKAVVGLIGVNCLVFLMWRVHFLQPMMARRFLADPYSKSVLPLLLSNFSHIEVWHLLINMVVLWNFFLPYVAAYTPEVSVPYFISAGVFASCVGHVAKTVRGLALPSLGASGALMAVVTSITYQHPDSHFYIIFLPFVPIPAVWALSSVVALDMAGLVMGWRFFDHAAHLGGVLFGLLFQSQILPQLPKLRHKTVSIWNRLTDNL